MDEHLDEEMSMMYEADTSPKVLSAAAFTKPIRHIRVRKPVTLSPEAKVSEAVAKMNELGLGCVLITDKGKLAGIFTERDVLKKVAGDAKAGSRPLREVMTPKVEGLQSDDSIAFVLNTMHVGGYRHVPITDEHGVPIAVVSVKDIVGYIIEHFPDEVVNLPPRPVRSTSSREGA